MPDPPARLVLFGANGDLAARMLFPSMAALLDAGLLPDDFRVTGSGTKDKSDDEFREQVAAALDEHAPDTKPETKDDLLGRLEYRAAEMSDAAAVADVIGDTDEPVVVYLALPPTLYLEAAKAVTDAGLPPGSRLVVEKPFGDGLQAARELNALLADRLAEEQVFRVDHFLAKQTVHNLAGLRFANRVFEPLWSNQHVEKVEIVYDETLALEGRARYYDDAGALVDMVQNHLVQMLCLVAMDPPATLDGEDLRDRRVSVLRATTADVDRSRRARYLGYTEEEGVDPAKETETFADVHLRVDSWRWAGVDFVLRSGKAMATDRQEVAVHFKPVPHIAFGEATEPPPNVLRLSFGPDRLGLELNVNADGELFDLTRVTLDTALAPSDLPAYANVLRVVFAGEHAFTMRADEAEEAWRIIEPIRDAWRSGKVPMLEYGPGSEGPTG